MRLDLPIPDGLRYGQAIFAFLLWLAEDKKVRAVLTCYTSYPSKPNSPVFNETHFEMADPFNIPDEQFLAWWNEWLGLQDSSLVK